VFCPSCGTSCPDTAIACHDCGNILPGLTEAYEPNPVATAEEVPSHETSEEMSGALGTLVAERGSFGDPVAVPKSSPKIASPGGMRLGHVKLVVEQGRILGEQFLLADHELMIGRYDAGSRRCPDIDLTAQDPAYVHRQHVRLAFNPAGDRLMVYDMGGRNGAYINNQLIEKNGSALVQLGDKLRVGRVVLRVQEAPEVDDRPTH
jgi:hypothetical protein